MRRASLAALLLAAPLLLAGCLQTTDDGDGTTPTTSPATGDVEPTVTLLEPSSGSEATAGEAFTVRWRVETDLSGSHEIAHTGVHWANNAKDPGSGDGPGIYGNTSGAMNPATIPGTFTTEVTIDDAETIYLRAHAIADGGTNYWSDEITIEVVEAMDGGGGQQTVHTVEMVSFGPPGFDPADMTISVGDGVQWDNVHSSPHTATADENSAFQWDTGTVDPGATSSVITFDSAGTFGYECTYHKSTMSGTITVEA